MENEKLEETKQTGKNKILMILTIFIILCIVGVGVFYFIKTNDKEESNTSNSNQQEESKAVSEELVKELKEMIGYDEDEEFPLLHMNFIGVNGVIDELDDHTKLSILNQATMDSRKSLPLDYDEICVDMDECPGIPITAIEETAKKYGITNPTKLFDDDQVYVKSGDYYIWLGSGYGMSFSMESSNFKASYQGEDIIVEEDIITTQLDETAEQKKYHISYTFKKDTEKNYYLYSVTSKDA